MWVIERHTAGVWERRYPGSTKLSILRAAYLMSWLVKEYPHYRIRNLKTNETLMYRYEQPKLSRFAKSIGR